MTISLMDIFRSTKAKENGINIKREDKGKIFAYRGIAILLALPLLVLALKDADFSKLKNYFNSSKPTAEYFEPEAWGRMPNEVQKEIYDSQFRSCFDSEGFGGDDNEAWEKYEKTTLRKNGVDKLSNLIGRRPYMPDVNGDGKVCGEPIQDIIK